MHEKTAMVAAYAKHALERPFKTALPRAGAFAQPAIHVCCRRIAPEGGGSSCYCAGECEREGTESRRHHEQGDGGGPQAAGGDRVLVHVFRGVVLLQKGREVGHRENVTRYGRGAQETGSVAGGPEKVCDWWIMAGGFGKRVACDRNGNMSSIVRALHSAVFVGVGAISFSTRRYGEV